MSLQLNLLIVGHLEASWGYSHEMLELPDAERQYKEINALPSFKVPPEFKTHVSRSDGKVQYGDTQTTPYGEPLMITYMKHLKTLELDGPVGAYIRESRDTTPVALYWY